jgi:hypothetical protein
LIDQIEENTGDLPGKGLADAGYRSESNLKGLEDRGIEGFVAFGREKCGPPKAPDAANEATGRMFSKMKTRGTEKVRGEWDLACLAMNLKRMHRRMAWA